jgi:fosfomycin resistance protein FosX
MDIQGLSHITFVVANLERMAQFLCDGLGAREVYDSENKNFSLSRERFFVLGGVWLAAMEGTPPSERSYQHLALKVAEADLPKFEQKLRALGAEIRPPRPRVDGEGLSLYFYDFDNHLFELHTGTLEQRLERYRSELPQPL